MSKLFTERSRTDTKNQNTKGEMGNGIFQGKQIY